MAVNIQGLPELLADLEALGAKTAEGAMVGAEAAAGLLASEIADDAPVATGALQSSVRAEGASVLIGGGDVDYAEDVENEQPFIQPAINRNKDKIVEAVADGIKGAIGA